MLKIGDFSKLCMVSVKTLRHYDSLGLLRPARVDDFTGYRYYSAAQIPQLNRILALKDLGLSLEQIAHLLQDDLSADQIRGILRLRAAEARERVAEEQARLVRVEARLRLIESEGKQPMYDVVLKKLPAQHIASLRRVIPTYGHLGELFGELFGVLMPAGNVPEGPGLAIYHDPEFRDHDPDIEVAIPVGAAARIVPPLTLRELPACDVASTIHRGPYEGITAAYEAVGAWIEPNGYQVAGALREVYLHGPGETNNPTEYVTELQVPVSRRE